VTSSPRGSAAQHGATESVLGIDLGTSAVKVLLAGPEERGATASYPVLTPEPGHAETDPDDWWRATRDAVREATATVEPAAIAVTGQMHGVVLTGAAGEPLRPAIVWLDRRAGGGNPGMPGPILRWLRQHEPDISDKARWALQPKDWLRMRLTGEAATDPTEASGTLLYDLDRGDWSARDRLLPPILPSLAVAGRLRADAAAELGLAPGIPVAVGAADTAASLLAADLPGPDWALLVLGTGGQWVIPAPPEAAPDPTGRTRLFAAVDGGRYRLAGARNVGSALDWVRRVLRASWAELYATAARGPATSSRFRPYLVPEPFDDITTGAAWTGLALSDTREDLMSAALTGVATLLRDHLDNLRAAGADPREVMITGGGSRDPAWRALLAQTLGLQMHDAPSTSLTVQGAARIARHALRG
jgi:xylulokinase